MEEKIFGEKEESKDYLEKSDDEPNDFVEMIEEFKEKDFAKKWKTKVSDMPKKAKRKLMKKGRVEIRN